MQTKQLEKEKKMLEQRLQFKSDEIRDIESTNQTHLKQRDGAINELRSQLGMPSVNTEDEVSLGMDDTSEPTFG